MSTMYYGGCTPEVKSPVAISENVLIGELEILGKNIDEIDRLVNAISRLVKPQVQKECNMPTEAIQSIKQALNMYNYKCESILEMLSATEGRLSDNLNSLSLI